MPNKGKVTEFLMNRVKFSALINRGGLDGKREKNMKQLYLFREKLQKKNKKGKKTASERNSNQA